MKIELRNVILFMLMAMAGTFAVAQSGNGDGQKVETACDNKFGTDSVETQKNLSMFNQYYKEKKYVEAFPYWYYLFNNAPCVQKRITYNGPYIIKKKLKDINKTQGKEAYSARLKNGLADTLFMCHELRIKFFGDEGKVKAIWADDMSKLAPKRRAEALAMFHEASTILGNNMKYDVPKDYVYSAVKQHKVKKLSLDSLFIILDEVTPVIDYNISKYTMPGLSAKDSIKGTKWIATQNSIINMLKPYLDCEKLVELKEPAYEENKGNASWLQSTVKLLDRGGCEGEAFYLKCSEQLFTLEPSSSAALALARAFKKSGDEAKSTSYYLKAADLATDPDNKFDIYIKLAKTSKNTKQYSKVREYARKALAINPNSGVAYILIGDAYAASASSCGSGKLGRGGVYLAAVDKYIKARNVDPSIALDANEKISKYSSYFPQKTDVFFLNMKDGDSYSVGCWIGETTTIRSIGG
ncbi:MAG: hypothetical protein KJP21_06265 [Bacteroidia bacterium]|nr:hypothetical protein [Bacteroidia bacterium]NNJ55473.1 hypothetical protein [Bacteroidia bacterium]